MVISQATPTFCIHVPMFDTTDAIQIARKAATARGLQAVSRIMSANGYRQPSVLAKMAIISEGG